MGTLLKRILAQASLPDGSIHGPNHWQQVAQNGLMIAQQEKLDLRVIELFAWFHDCRREHDGIDPEHGPRAAQYLESWSPRELGITLAQKEQLILACKYHTYEIKTDDMLVRACWDADRLDLPRVGIKIDIKRLFTDTARRIAQEAQKIKLEEID